MVSDHASGNVAGPDGRQMLHPHSDLAGWYRAANSVGRWLQRRAPARRWDVEQLLESASRRTGLVDFGHLDGDFQAGLHAWLQATDDEAGLSPLGRLSMRAETTWMLCNRLRLQRELERQPDLLDEPVARPVFVIGLPRSGTTLLHRLLALDRAYRAPLTWELFEPLASHAGAHDPRRLRARAKVAGALAIQRRLRSVHPLEAGGPEECVLALQQTFCTSHFATIAHVPSYEAWLDAQSLAPAYRYHRAILAVLQQQQPSRRWILKAPVHLYGLAALLEIFPDARIVQVHRDPIETTASGCDLTALLRGFYSDRVERQALGQEWLHTWGTALDRALAARRLLPPGQVCDVHYRELVAGPLETVARVRRYFGEEVSAEFEAAMQWWLAANPKDRHGRHEYQLGEFGVTARQVRERFEDYGRTFDLWSEPRLTAPGRQPPLLAAVLPGIG